MGEWDAKDCTSKSNVYISTKSTPDLLKYIEEKKSFEDTKKLYYYFDYTVAMQIIDKQTVCFNFIDGRKICLMNIGLHKDGKDLYAVMIPNDTNKKTKKRWKVIDHDDNNYYHIMQA